MLILKAFDKSRKIISGNDYKKNMFALLGKPGFEELAKELNERL
ncbi:hypothetical protein [Vagococcus penaei]|nr:hypothetical protein [Vagococcus penaei]